MKLHWFYTVKDINEFLFSIKITVAKYIDGIHAGMAVWKFPDFAVNEQICWIYL